MRVERIKIKGFLGIDNLDLRLDKQLVLIAGGNCVGKTSILHSLMFVLTDNLCRVAHKKDVKRLIRDGHKVGNVEITVDGVTHNRSAATGHYVSPHPPPEPHPALRYCLDPAAFTQLPSQERRGFLYKLMGVKLAATDIIATLEARKHPIALIERIATHLRSGFPSAYNEMMGLGRELKGSYRELTGEIYGEVKASTWSCEAPGVDQEDMDKLTVEISRLDGEIATLQARQGALTERAANRKRIMEHMENNRRIAGEHDARQAALKELRARIDVLTAEQRELREQLGRAKCGLTVEAHASQGTFFKCPACGVNLNYSRGECKVGEPVAVDVTDEIALVAEQVKELQIAVNNVDDRKCIADRLMVDAINAVGESQAAVAALADFKEEENDGAQGDAGIEEALNNRGIARGAARQALVQLESALWTHNQAADKTQRARAIHEEIQAATALAADLAPDGLPAELLAKAMRPINERLRDSSVMAGWPSVSITTDEILIHSRDWSLASESEQWRARVQIAEAISYLSGVKLFCLDGLDILEPARRAQALAWLLAVAPEHETIIVLATLKQAPANLPGEIQSVWLG